MVEALGAKGARFLSELAADTGRLPTDIEEALWDGVARGLLTADGFAAIRSLVEGRDAGRRPPGRSAAAGAAPAAPPRPPAAGR